MAGPIQHFDLWLNAFVPAACPPWTERVAVDGATVVYGLGPAVGPYWTDQRSFSTDPGASSCLHARIRLACSPTPRVVDQWHAGRPLHAISPETSPLPEMSDRTARQPIGLYSLHTVHQHAVASKLVRLIPRMGPTPAAAATWYLHLDVWSTPEDGTLHSTVGDMGCRGIVQLDLSQRKLQFHGHLGRFPAYEMYVTVNDGPAVAIFRQSPPRDATAFQEPSTTPRPMRAVAEF